MFLRFHDILSPVIVTIRGDSMLFDPRPKTKREDLFDREKELETLQSGDAPMILILAPRRYGKTSLLNVFLNEIPDPHIFIDCRALIVEETSKEVFYRFMTNEINRIARSDKNILKWIERIKGIKIFGFEVSFAEYEKSPPNLGEIMKVINDWSVNSSIKTLLVFDEAQLLRFFRRRGGIDFVDLFSYIYDNLEGIRIILTGSEVGILKDFLGINEVDSPMYGRYISEINLSKFSKDMSLEFLLEGFKQIGMEPTPLILEKAVYALDGVVGWLVMFGNKAVERKRVDDEILNEVLSEAKLVVKNELEQLFKNSEKYRYILKALSYGANTWGSIKEAVEFYEGRKITDASFTRILNRLISMGYVNVRHGEKKIYEISDPIVAKVVKE